MSHAKELAARLIVPAIRADAADGAWAHAEEEARAGFGGFLLFGGERETVASRLASLRRSAPAGNGGTRPFLVYSDLERGAGQQIRGLTRLPHLMAIGAAAAGDRERGLHLSEEAGFVTAIEARRAGIHVLFAPCVDLNTDAMNPIINIRAFGDDPARVADLAAAWSRGALRGKALCCAKHFPGHGHTSVDSHISLPRLDAPLETLEARELIPFLRLAREGVASVMTAHMAVPALTGEKDLPVTLSSKAVRYLRERAGYDGLVITDALLMGGLTGAFDEAEAGIRALLAGCDVLLCPSDARELLEKVTAAIESGRVPMARVEEAVARVERAIRACGADAPPPDAPAEPLPEGNALADEIAARALAALETPTLRPLASDDRSVLVILSGDDGEAGGELSAEVLRHAPRARIFPLGPDSPDARVGMIADTAIAAARAGAPVVVAAFSRMLAWKGAAGLAERERGLLARLCAEAKAGVVSLGSPYLLREVSVSSPLRACAFAYGPASQRAVARAITLVPENPADLARRFPGRFPVSM